MKKMRLSILSILCIAALMASAACAQEDFATCQQAVVDTFQRYVSAQTERLAPMLWALDKIDDYCASPSWEALLRAGTACDACRRSLSVLENPESALDASMINTLDANGVEWLVAADNIEIFPIEHAQDVELWENYGINMLYLSLSREQAATIAYTTELKRREIELNLQYTALSANYLYLTLQKPMDGETLWTRLRETEPLLSAYMGDYLGTLAEVEEQLPAVLDRLDEVTLDMNKGLGLNAYLAQTEAKDLTPLEMPDERPYLLLPPVRTTYEVDCIYARRGDDGAKLVQAFEDLTLLPDVALITWTPNNPEEVSAYLNLLEELGIQPAACEGDPATDVEWMLSFGDAGNVLYSADGQVSLMLNPQSAAPAPTWYLIASPKR